MVPDVKAANVVQWVGTLGGAEARRGTLGFRFRFLSTLGWIFVGGLAGSAVRNRWFGVGVWPGQQFRIDGVGLMFQFICLISVAGACRTTLG